MSENLYAQFNERLRQAAADPFLETPDGTTISYAEADSRSAQLANLLVHLGVHAGDRVAVQAEKSPQALLAYLACLRVGAVYLPLNPAYTLAEVRYFLDDAKPALFICRPADLDAMTALAMELGVAQVRTLGADGEGSLCNEASSLTTRFSDAPARADDLAAILYTSGTTGRSKGAMLTHHNLASNARTLAQLWRFEAQDKLLHALPIFHTHGLFVATNVTLMAGGGMIFLPAFDADELIRQLPRASVLMGVPTFYTRLLAHPALDRDLVRHMRLFVSGSAPLSAETHREFQDRTGHPILERYGMTETNMNSSNPYDGARVAGTVGPPLPGVDIRITDPETGRPTPGETGMIEVRGPNVFKGYWNQPEKTAADFRADGFFITGDLGRFDERGYLQIVGRAKDLIISGGFNVYPAEVEAAIMALPGVADCAVIGAPHPDFGEGVIAVLTARPGEQLEPSAIIAGIADQLARYKQPKRIIVADDLPRNAMGKVQKKTLRDQYAATFQT